MMTDKDLPWVKCSYFFDLSDGAYLNPWHCGNKYSAGKIGENGYFIPKAEAKELWKEHLDDKCYTCCKNPVFQKICQECTLTHIDKIHEENVRLRVALEYYANPCSWVHNPEKIPWKGIDFSGTKIAQEALKSNE